MENDGNRGTAATAIAALCTGSAYLIGILIFARSVWFGARLSLSQRADPMFCAAAICLVFCAIGLVGAIIARVRLRAVGTVPPRIPPVVADVLLAASVIGLGGAAFLALAGSILAIPVGYELPAGVSLYGR